MSKKLQAALKYMELGLSIIPVKADKRPLVKWEPYQKNRADKKQLEQWWKKWPSANIGIVTGKISNLIVLDPDTEAGFAALNEFLSESFEAPIAKTPSGGHHIYFEYRPGLPNSVKVLTDTDIRTDGGYIVAPPSYGKYKKNGNQVGGGYYWYSGLSVFKVKPPPIPDFLFNTLQARSGAIPARAHTSAHKIERIHSSTRTGVVTSPKNHGDNKRQHLTTSDNIGFTEGCRDNTLFTLANHLVKGGMPREDIEIYLNFIAQHCSPPFPQKEIPVKIHSAFKRLNAREKGLTEEIRELIMTTNDNISTTFVYNCLHLTTRDNKKKATVILGRLVKEGLLEPTGQAGVYRRVRSDCEPENWQDASTDNVNLWLPFDLDEIAIIPPGGIITIAGEPNAGKTAILLNIAKENRYSWNVHYFSSELSPGAFKRRVNKFLDVTPDQLNIQLYQRADNFADVIKPGEGNLNIIDFLEMYENFYLVSKHLADIYKKLAGAVAVIGLQKGKGRDDGHGGTFTREKAILSLAVSSGKIKITKLKEWADGSENPNRKEFHFKLIDGCRFKKTMGWHTPVEK